MGRQSSAASHAASRFVLLLRPHPCLLNKPGSLIPSSGVELFPHQVHCLSEDKGRVSAPQWFQGLRPRGWLSASPTVLPMMLLGPLKVVLW